MARDAAGIGPGVRREQRYPHGRQLYRRATPVRLRGRRPAIIAAREQPSLRQVHVPEARSGVASPRRAERRERDKREFIGRLRGLRRRSPAAELLARRHARRRRADAARRGGEPRADPRVPRRARAERVDEVGARSRTRSSGMRKSSEYSEDERTCPARVPRQVRVRVPVREVARVVRAARRGALADHAGAHPGRPRIPGRRQPHDLLASGSTTRSSWSPSTPTTSARSSISCSACARPRPRASRSATPPASRASRCRSSAR